MTPLLGLSIPPLVASLAVLLIAAAAISYLATRIKLMPIVGFVIAGAVVGPNALGVVSDAELVEQTAEIGVIFLLFGIGLELSADRLRALGKLLFGGGAVQVVVTTALVAAGCMAFGVDLRTSIYTGALVSLSSTAIVLKLLSDRRQTNSPVGEVAVSFLIFQDLAVVVMVLLVPLLAPGSTGDLGDVAGALLRSAIALAFVMGATRWLVPRALDRVAAKSTDEVFLLSVAAFALVVAYGATLLGLTDSLGAFIAGLVISSSRHRERALRYITPFQMLFSAIFFASIGMLLDVAFVLDRWQLVLILAIGTVVAKVAGSAIAARAFGRPWPVVITSAFLLAQVGEFSFVLQQNGREVGLSPAGVGEQGSQLFIATAVLLFVLTPVLDVAGRRAGAWVERRSLARGGVPTIVPPKPVVVLGGPPSAHALIASAVEQSGLPNPVVVASDGGGSTTSSEGRDPAIVVAIDPERSILDAFLDEREGAPEPIPVVAWIRDPEEAHEVASLDHIRVIDAGAAGELTVARALLDALGVEQDRRITALTKAVESLPADMRRPLA